MKKWTWINSVEGWFQSSACRLCRAGEQTATRWRLTLLNPAVIQWHRLWNVCDQLPRSPEPSVRLVMTSVWGFSADGRQIWERLQNNDRKTSFSVLTAPSLMKVWHSFPTLPLERDIFFRKSSPLSIITFLHWERSCGRNTANITRSVTLKEKQQRFQSVLKTTSHF